MTGFRAVKVGGRTVIDDHQRLYPLKWAGIFRRDSTYFPKEFATAWRQDAQSDIRFFGFGQSLWIGFAIVIAVYGILDWLGLVSVSIWIKRIALVSIGAIFVYYQTETAPLLARRLCMAGRCVSCGYEIAGCPAAEDGCTICPECGAAWQLATESASQDPTNPSTPEHP